VEEITMVAHTRSRPAEASPPQRRQRLTDRLIQLVVLGLLTVYGLIPLVQWVRTDPAHNCWVLFWVVLGLGLLVWHLAALGRQDQQQEQERAEREARHKAHWDQLTREAQAKQQARLSENAQRLGVSEAELKRVLIDLGAGERVP
jgi:hypothetical protein